MCFFFANYHFPKQDKPSETDNERNDSIWATIAGFSKTYRVSFDYILYDLSYINLMMYSKVLPSYSIKKDKDKREKTEEKPLTQEEFDNVLDNLKKYGRTGRN